MLNEAKKDEQKINDIICADKINKDIDHVENLDSLLRNLEDLKF